jgi:hypothetical protein
MLNVAGKNILKRFKQIARCRRVDRCQNGVGDANKPAVQHRERRDETAIVRAGRYPVACVSQVHVSMCREFYHVRELLCVKFLKQFDCESLPWLRSFWQRTRKNVWCQQMPMRL